MHDLRVFISSTFRDLHEEREHLVKKIFPEIRALCRRRGVTFTEIDLRWGLTEEQATHGTIIRTCLEEVDKCRPYFIGMLGSRYGWAPDLHEILVDPDLTARFPWVEDAASDGASLTEMEFVHGVFNTGLTEGQFACFYHRPRSGSETDNPERLARLIERVRDGGYPLRLFNDPEELGRLVESDLLAMIERFWPEDHTPSPLDRERQSHAAFSASRRRAYIPNPVHLKQFNTWLTDGTTPLMVCAESGLGKSAIAAYLADSYRAKHPTDILIEHYVGASEQSGSAAGLMRHVIDEIRDRFAIEDDAPNDPVKLIAEFPNWLWRLGHVAAENGQRVLLLIDALNQLDRDGRRLAWLPLIATENVHLLVTATPGDALDALRTREWEELPLTPVADERIRQTIVLRYLGEFRKGVSAEQLRRITSDAKGSSPLYLRVVAEELRLHGDHETLDGAITRYTTAPDLDDVFQRVLERMERDYGAERMERLLSLIWGSRGGLSEVEMLELTGESRLDLSRMLFALDEHLIRHNGLFGFFHDFLRRAVHKRYLAADDDQRQVHQRLADYFSSLELDQRSGNELLWQYRQSLDDSKMAEFLGRLDVVALLYREQGEYELPEHWVWLRSLGHDPGSFYRLSAAKLVGADETALRSLLHCVKLLEHLSEWKTGIELAGPLLREAGEAGSADYQAKARLALGGFLIQRGEYDESLAHLEVAMDLFKEMGDRGGIARCIGNMGNVYKDRGEFDRALECFMQGLTICREVGDRRGIAVSNISVGNVYKDQGDYDRALECLSLAIAICEELGDRTCAALAIGNVGSIYRDRGDLDRALEHYRQQIVISEESGNRNGIALGRVNMGLAYTYRAEHSLALECYQESLKICEELGDRRGVATAIGNMGIVHLFRGEVDVALECFQRMVSVAREIGDRNAVAYASGNMGTVYGLRGDYDRALESFRQWLTVSEEIGDRHAVALASGNVGIVHANRGEFDLALKYLGRQVSICEDMGDVGGIALANGNMGEAWYGLGDYQRSLECYDRALKGHRSTGYRYGITFWLEGRARVMLELRDQKELPPYLTTFLPDATTDNWRTLTLQQARLDATECLAVSRDVSKPDSVYSSQVYLARIEAAEGHAESALTHLHELLQQAADDGQRAESYYWQWRIQRGEMERREAARLYQQIAEKTPKHEYKRRLEELERKSAK